MRVRKHGSGPEHRAPRMRIELRWLVESGRNAIMISSNGQRFQTAKDIDRFDRIWTVSDDVAAAKHRFETCMFCAVDTGVERFDVRMDVTQDEIAHGV